MRLADYMTAECKVDMISLTDFYNHVILSRGKGRVF